MQAKLIENFFWTNEIKINKQNFIREDGKIQILRFLQPPNWAGVQSQPTWYIVYIPSLLWENPVDSGNKVPFSILQILLFFAHMPYRKEQNTKNWFSIYGAVSFFIASMQTDTQKPLEAE